MATIFTIRRKTTAEWNACKCKIPEGEITLDTTINRLKVGDGEKLWSELPYIDVQVFDNCDTTDSNNALSANQGKILKELIDSNRLVVDNLTSTSTVAALSANQGKELKRLIDVNRVSVVDNLTNTSTTAALSANQGKTLKALIDKLANGGVVIVNSLTSMSTTAALSANQGRQLKRLIDGIDTKVNNLGIFGMGYEITARNSNGKPTKIKFDDDVTATIEWDGQYVKKITASTGEVMEITHDEYGRITGRKVIRGA